MTLDTAVQLLELTTSLVRGQLSGTAQSDAAVATTLTDIIQTADHARKEHAGQPIDLSLIKPEAAI
jgi:hypothetical protein